MPLVSFYTSLKTSEILREIYFQGAQKENSDMKWVNLQKRGFTTHNSVPISTSLNA